MITKSQILYTSILSSILGAGGLGYYFLSGNSASPSTQSNESLNSEDPITITGDNAYTTQRHVNETTPVKQQYDERDIDIKFKDGNAWINKPVTDKYPSWKNDPYLVEQAERYKKLDPVLYRHSYDNPFHRTVDSEEAKKKINVLMDYTMMIVDCSGGRGTGWILDYVLPEGNQKYPTKFFIASAGHVVNDIKWDSNNPYGQLLSAPEKDSPIYHHCFVNNSQEKATLIKEKVKAHENDDFDKSKWAQSRAKNKYQMWNIDSKYDVSKYKGQSNSNVDFDYWQFTLQRPKLVYFPHNYLRTSKHQHQEYSADFAVFEVDFGDENVAKLFTRDFYGKYDREKGTHKEKALNFFADPLHKTYTSQQLLENDIQFWSAGYPGVGHSHKASTNYNINRKSASRLTYHRSIKDTNDRLMLGLQPAPGSYWNWNGKPVKDISYWYALDNPEVEHGASGSVITTGDNNVVGLFSYISGSSGIYIGGATPIRNAKIQDKEGKVIFDEYDFIEGAEGQNGSYKEQIQKYFLKYGKQTSLSKLRGWTA